MMNTKLANKAAPPPAAPAVTPTPTPPAPGSARWPGLVSYLPKISLPKIDLSYFDVSKHRKAWDNYAQKVVAEQKAKTKEQNDEMLKSVLLYGLSGFGAGLSGTKLYNLIKSVNKPKNKYTKFGPGAKTVDDEEKIAEEKSIITQIADTVKAIPGHIAKKLPPAPQVSGLSQDQQAMFIPAVLGATGLGLYGGHSLMNAIQEHKRKEDIKMMVEEAKQEYQRALTGKRAEALDAAYAAYEEKTAKNDAASWLGWGVNKMADPMRAVPGLWPAYVTAVLGTGALSGKMTYDWARERSKDKALERARKSRARISGVSPVYIDPDQIVAISELAKKQRNAPNQQ